AGETLTVGVPSPFIQNWIHKHFRLALLQVARSLVGPAATVRLDVDPALVLKTSSGTNCATKPDSPDQAAARHRRSAPARTDRPHSERTAKRPKRQFADLSDFVKGPCNELALMAVRQVCEQPGCRLNPLFIHGSVGTGKTHLLEGCYRLLRRKHPRLNVLFLTSESFANYFTQALGERTLPSFRQRFRTVDVLLLDDVDFLNGKRVIQEEFLHTVQQLEARRCQLVVTSDRHPRLLTRLSDELVSRFVSGLVCRLESPDLETRQQIVRRKAAGLEAELTTDALDYVATRFRNNVRELEGALNCLSAHYVMLRKPIGVADARRLLSDLERDCVRLIRLADIEQAVCEMFGVRPDDLRSAKRQRSVSQPRMLAMFLARKHTQAAYREIGQYFGGRNHSTVL
ncbi:MAG TPA: chromosomal replication initiator protein DnaA, partial [Planctomycetaceae bacterium]|nr:chromosomal replication initiator protein DnaA [Planctomycetaceae bacterium]